MTTQPTDFQDTIPEVDAVAIKLTDAMTPGAQIEFDPSEAEKAGAFPEDALSLDDAEAATAEVLEG